MAGTAGFEPTSSVLETEATSIYTMFLKSGVLLRQRYDRGIAVTLPLPLVLFSPTQRTAPLKQDLVVLEHGVVHRHELMPDYIMSCRRCMFS